MCKLKISGRNLKYQELLAFSEHVIKHLPESIRTEEVVVNFVQAYRDFYHAINRKNSVQFRRDLSAADKDVCQARQAFRAILTAGSMHPDPFIANAARQIETLVPRIADPNRMTRDLLIDACKITLDRLNAVPDDLIHQFECIRPYYEDFSNKMSILLNGNSQLEKVASVRASNNAHYRALTSSWKALQDFINNRFAASHDISLKNAINNINAEFLKLANQK